MSCRSAVGRASSWQRAGIVCAGLALPATLLTGCGSGGGSDNATSDPVATASSSSTAPASSAAQTSSGASQSTGSGSSTGSAPAPGASDQPLPVYWIGDTKRSTFLYREFVRSSSSGDAVTAALNHMMSKSPTDKDYRTMWKSPSRLTVRQSGNDITVDVSADAFSGKSFGARQAQRSIQQLVWTATAAAQTQGAVSILVDGRKGYKAWNTVALGTPMKRVATARAPIWIDTPTQGAVFKAGAIPIKGSANVFEGNVIIEITDAAGKNVARTLGEAAMGTYKSFSTKVTLSKPGTYTLTAYEPDVSDGEGGEGPKVYPVTTTFTVR